MSSRNLYSHRDFRSSAPARTGGLNLESDYLGSFCEPLQRASRTSSLNSSFKLITQESAPISTSIRGPVDSEYYSFDDGSSISVSLDSAYRVFYNELPVQVLPLESDRAAGGYVVRNQASAKLKRQRLSSKVVSTPQTQCTTLSISTHALPAMAAIGSTQQPVVTQPLVRRLPSPNGTGLKQVKVAARFLPAEPKSAEISWNIKGKNQIVLPKSAQTFFVDQAFGPEVSNTGLYESFGRPLMKSLYAGRKCVVLTFGGAAQGRAYTLHGSPKDDQRGVIQSAVSDLLEMGDAQLSLQFFEVEQDAVVDLLATDSELEMDERDGTVNAYRTPLGNLSDLQYAMENAKRLPPDDSNSVLRLHVERQREGAPARRSYVDFVDFGGDAKQSSVARIVELLNTKNSLSLGTQNETLLDTETSSKLVDLVRFHASKDSRVGLICCVSSSKADANVTEETLSFAQRVRRASAALRLRTKSKSPTSHQAEEKGTLLNNLRQEISKTQERINEIRARRKQQAASVNGSDHFTVSTGVVSTSQSKTLVPDTISSFKKSSDKKLVRKITSEQSTGTNTVTSKTLNQSALVAEPKDLNLSHICSGVLDDGISGPPPMDEVVVMVDVDSNTSRNTLEELDEAEARVEFLTKKLEATNDLVESLFNDLQDAQEQNIALELRNSMLHKKLIEEGTEATSEDHDALMEQCVMLKYAIVVGLIFLACGQSELFLSTVMFLWLSLVVVSK